MSRRRSRPVRASHIHTLASGLEVFAIGGDPGVYSARWAGPDKDFGVAMRSGPDALVPTTEQTDASRLLYCMSLRLIAGMVALGAVAAAILLFHWDSKRDLTASRDSASVPWVRRSLCS